MLSLSNASFFSPLKADDTKSKAEPEKNKKSDNPKRI
jgi:hypothetical protein